MAQTLTKGMKVSVKLTPQAQDDYLHFGEDSGGGDSSTADLLANDGGGNAAQVWGIFAQTETEVQNHLGDYVNVSAPQAANSFAVGSATVSYNAATGDISVSYDSAGFQHLGAGESEDLGTFTYIIRLGNGTFSTAVAHIVIDGSNDDPTLADVNGLLVADTPVHEASFPELTGTLIGQDVDDNDQGLLTYEAVGHDSNGNVVGLYGTLHVGSDGSWTYTPNASAVDALGAGQDDTDVFQVAVHDAHGGTGTANLTINVTGADEPPAGGNTEVHTADQDITFKFDAPVTGLGGSDAHGHIDLPADGFNFSGTIDFSVKGDVDGNNEHVFVRFENGTQVDASGSANGDGSEPGSATLGSFSVAFSSTDSSLDIAYHTSNQVNGTVEITGVAHYTYETLAV